MSIVVLDVDGTLVDSSYHHIQAWARAFRQHGVEVPMARLHAHVGMGGDRLVAAAAGDLVERVSGDAIRDAWRTSYDELLEDVVPLDGARRLVDVLPECGVDVVLATSGNLQHAERTLRLLDLEPGDVPLVSAADVTATKPSPDLVLAALDRAGGGPGLAVGDTVWDVRAAGAAGMPSIGLLTGGIDRRTLVFGGASYVYTSPLELLANLDEALSLLPLTV